MATEKMNKPIVNIQPAYDFSLDKNNRVYLKKGKARISINGNKYNSDCDVYLDLSQSSGIKFYSCFKNIASKDVNDIFNGGGSSVKFTFDGRIIEGFATKFSFKDLSDMELTWCPKSERNTCCGTDKTLIDKIVFHIFNGNELNRFISMDFQGWNVSINLSHNYKKNVDLLKQDGGYQLTHVGEIKRIDRKSFVEKDVEFVLTSLNYFLSFSLGKWINPICLTGYNKKSKIVWERLSSPKSSWYSPIAWIPRYNIGNCLDEFYTKFMTLYSSNERWKECLHEVIYWYLNANDFRRGIDAGIILIQAAIERLSYEFVVKDRELLTTDGFKDLRASDKFRILFASLKIPLGIPNICKNISGHQKAKEWKNSPYALTEIRNSLVHPEHKNNGKFEDLYFEAWNLSLWYLEMSILAICEYNGTHQNRLKIGNNSPEENVPWTKT